MTIHCMNWNEIYNILVAECGATEYWREDFIRCMNEGCREYRFQGNLGFGGKLYKNSNRLYVGCYLEDCNPERDAQIENTNKKLTSMLKL